MTNQDQLIKDVETTIDAVKSKVAKMTNEMNASFDSAAEISKNKFSDTVKTLEEKQLEVESKLKGLKASAGDASEDIVIGVKMAWEDLKTTVDSVASRF